MRILRISTRIYPDVGGPAKQVYLLSKFCSRKNIKVINIACKPKTKSKVKKEIINENFEINYLPIFSPRLNEHFFKLIPFFFIYFIIGFIKTCKINRKYKIDLIHAHSPPPAGLIAYFLFKIFKIPYIYSIHGLDYPNPLILDIDIYYVAQNAQKTIVVSRNIEKYIKKKYKLKNIYWLPNSINISNYYHVKSENEKDNLIQKLKLESFLKKDDFIITYIGYMIFLQKVQGMIDFLIAFSKFLIKIKADDIKKKIKLLYIGDGKYSYLLKKAIEDLKLSRNVCFLGKRSDIKDILALSDLLALTSYIEGFPNVLLEAMASKVPCLGTDVGEIKTIIKDAGYVVKPGDIDKIEKFLEKFYNLNDIKRQELMKKASERVKHFFNIETIGKKLTNIYFQK